MIVEAKDQWWNDRWEKFTASEIGKLMVGGKGEMFGEGAKTYIRQKAIEHLTVMWEKPYLEYLKPLLHGKAHEYPAFAFYKEITRNYSMRYFGTDDPLYLSYDDESGGSPDGIMGEETDVHLLLELKCPINSSVHMDYLQMDSQFDLQVYNGLYYAQTQFSLMYTKASCAHFFSFDDRYKNPKLKGKIIEVLPDKKFQDNLDIRLKMAVKEKYRIVEELMSKIK
jgi:hypothetical protein